MTNDEITDGVIYNPILNEFFGVLRVKVRGVIIVDLECQTGKFFQIA